MFPIADRLLATPEIDDREPGMDQTEGIFHKDSMTVRTAMSEGIDHGPKHGLLDARFTQDQPGDSTHVMMAIRSRNASTPNPIPYLGGLTGNFCKNRKAPFRAPLSNSQCLGSFLFAQGV